MKTPENSNITGIITSRTCPSCGHHEVGVTTTGGDFCPLRPGTWVQIIGSGPTEVSSMKPPEKFENTHSEQSGTSSEKIPWAPDQARKFRSLALKFGVMIPSAHESLEMDSHIYKRAYLHKLSSLIEKENEKPLAVILDQFFSAPHLASGNSREIALNMWNELEEIREPAERIFKMLESRGDEDVRVNEKVY